MPTRRMRLPPAAKRRLNHWVSALSALQAQPAPGQLHQQRPRSPVARLADALLDLAVTAGVGRGRQSQAAGQLAPVGEAPPAEQLLDQHPGALGPDGAQLGQLRHQRLLAILELLAPRGLQRLDLLLDQRQPRALALDLGAQQRRHLRAVVAPTRQPSRARR